MLSIRLRLALALFLTTAALAIAASIATYLQARSDVNALFDYEMQEMARTLSMHLSAHPNLTDEPLLTVEHDFVTQVWSKQRQLLVSSRSGAGPARAMPAGFGRFREGNNDWRTFTSIAGDYVLQVAQPQSLRLRMAADIALKAMVPVLTIIPIGGGIIWLIVGYGLRPLSLVAHKLESRAPESLQRIPDSKLPTEIAPLIKSLNNLLGRLDRALSTERAFLADASHELRTPVAALALQVGLLESSTTAQERDDSVQDLKLGVERIQRLIEQILTLARLDPDNTEQGKLIDVSTLVQDIQADYERIANASSIAFEVKVHNAAMVRDDQVSLKTLVRNILDNAMRYTPKGGRVTLEISNQGATPQIRVTDSGPGIPAKLREEVFSRFFRADHALDDTGAGLGLSIAKRAAERLGAKIQLQDGPKGTGLSVLICFPRLDSGLRIPEQTRG